jgi:hypothetical protein
MKGILKEEPIMLNPKVKELYTEDTIKVLQELSDIMENKNHQVYFGSVREAYGIRCPGVMITSDWGDNKLILDMYYKLTKNLTDDERDEHLMGMSPYTTKNVDEGMIPLWVK